MDINTDLIQNLIISDKYKDLDSFVECLHSLIYRNIQSLELVTAEILDKEFLEELKIYSHGSALYFGKTLSDIKCIIIDDEGLREHEIYIKYNGPRKLVVSGVNLPYSSFQDGVYTTLDEVLSTFRDLLNNLSNYFYELEKIDKYCTVVDPVNPTFKENYRRILLDDRVWLHLEVSQEGLATNIHFMGQSEQQQDKLQEGLLKWDHDKDIVENIMTIFDMIEFPDQPMKSMSTETIPQAKQTQVPHQAHLCSICLCDELPDKSGVPLPLCQNAFCGVYFHRNCLFQWLVACSGGRPPAFAVASGSCPTCLQSISCNEKDN